jgi:transposase
VAERGGRNAKKRAVVGITRKLAILLHHLWKTGETCDPFHQSGVDGLKSSPVARAA